jgi:hypothetical protein
MTPLIKTLAFCGLLLFAVSCTKDRLPEPNPVSPTPLPNDTLNVERHTLFINEFVARGSQNINEFGSAEDWFELFNPAFEPITLVAGRWFVSDNGPENPMKYELPEITIPSRGFLVIWADNEDVVADDIHTNFALSASGEHLVVYYKIDDNQGVVVDDYSYGQQEPAVSEGRFPDGGEVWTFFNLPTPGAPNQ